MTPLTAAAAEAPTSAGVYFFLAADRELLYIGKAGNLRRRLQQHAKNGPGRGMYGMVHDVRWEELADDDDAAAREADLIVALQPSYNASITDDGRWTYLTVTAEGDACRFSVAAQPGRTGVGVYGCFPHLGKGVGSRPAIACSDGYTGLLRLLWATGGDDRRYPRSISGPSPPFDVTVRVPSARRPPLRRFLSGTSPRLLDDLWRGIADVEPFLRPALGRDLDLARGFFDHGPAALRRLRLRHGVPAGPVRREVIEALLLDEIRAHIGHVQLPPASRRRRRRRNVH